ncbi:hypothetical protein C8T65DRAFT_663634 [Cerioporus squamosus]|nr:hypothetical protein C8T65DRAFT_663634 [Cerioporus squamosus]
MVLNLPVEVLHRILDYVPEPENKDVWLSSMVDTTMLLPISQTCRRLHEITISHPTLWRSLTIGAEPKARALARDAISRSRSRPLTVDLSLSSDSEMDAVWPDIKAFWPEIAARVRELHLLLRFHYPADPPWDPMFNRAYPQLDSFSLLQATAYDFPAPFPPFAEGVSSHLRRLHLRSVTTLPRCKFPGLTHLALGDIELERGSIIELLGRCPKLESLIIYKLSSLRIRPNAAGQAQCQDLLGSLPHLRRVRLQDLSQTYLSFFLDRIPKHPQGYSLHVANRYCDAGAILHGHSVVPVSTMHIRLDPSQWNAPEFYSPSVAFLGSQSVVRVETSTRLAFEHPSLRNFLYMDGPDWLRHTFRDKSALQSVSEVWVVNFRTDWWDACAEPLRTTIVALPALEIISIVMDQSRGCGEPDLRILPGGHDVAFDSPRLKTARLVYGCDRHVEYRRIVDSGQYGDLLKPRETKQLSLSRVIEQLKSGAFEYLDRLVLCAASHLMFDEAEVEQLRGYVSQVDVEYSDVTPGVLLPEYAREPEASGHPEYWNGCFH